LKFSKTVYFFIVIAIILHLSAIKAYPGWFKHYGGTGDDSAKSIQQTSDGGYITAGFTQSYTHGSYDIAIYKLDSSGNKVWFKNYGGASEDNARSIQQTSDGGYIVAGWTYSFTYGSSDIAIYKLTSSGNKVWFKNYGGTDLDYGHSIQQTSDGGYIVAGETASYSHGNYDFAIYKLDSSGNKVWFKHYGGSGPDYGKSIRQTSDGGYIVAGITYTYTYGDYDFAIYRLDSSGNKAWFKHYGGVSDDAAYSIQQTSDGGYIVAGYTESYTNGNQDYAIYKLDSSGNKVWFKHYGGNSFDFGESTQQTSDGGYIVVGYMQSYTYGNWDFGIYKLNSDGNKAWFKHYGGTQDDQGLSVQQTSDGGYVVAGNSQSYTNGSGDFAIYKLDSNGDK